MKYKKSVKIRKEETVQKVCKRKVKQFPVEEATDRESTAEQPVASDSALGTGWAERRYL